MALEEGGRVDFARLRRERLKRCLTVMDQAGIDVLVLGRESNARYVSGARRLWNAGTRPFGPGCVVVGSSAQVHLLSTWDDGVPPEIPRENLFGLTWNPAGYARVLEGIPGVGAARRVGVDGMSASFARIIESVAPHAELVDGSTPLTAARATKTPDEIMCIRIAIGVAEASLAHCTAHLTPGVTERQLLGRFEERMSQLGLTIPAMEGTFCTIPRQAGDRDGRRHAGGHALRRDRPDAPLRQVSTNRSVDGGDLVAMRAGVMYAGYEGSLARTWLCPPRATGSRRATGEERRLHHRWAALWERLSDCARPGLPAGDLLGAYDESGEPMPPFPVAHGVGLGMEPPLVGRGVPADAGAVTILEPGMVLSIGGYTWTSGLGGYLASEVVLITDEGHQVLTRHSHGPLSL